MELFLFIIPTKSNLKNEMREREERRERMGPPNLRVYDVFV